MPVAKGIKNKKIETVEKETILATVKPLSHSVVIDELGKTQVKVQKTLADLSSELTSRITQLDTVEAAIRIEEDRLKELHEIEAAAVTLDELRAQIEAERIAAEDAEDARLVGIKEREVERQKISQREEDEYTYKTQQARAKAVDQFNTFVEQKKRDEQVREQTQNRLWAEREASLKAQEKEVADLRIRVTNIQTEIDTAVKREVGITINRLTRENDHATALAKVTTDSEKRLAEATIANREATVVTMQKQIETLQNELQAANDRAESIASKALDSASDRRALEAVERNNQNTAAPTQKSSGR